VEVWQTSNLRWLRLGEEKKKEEDRTNYRAKNILSASATQGAHNKCISISPPFLNGFTSSFQHNNLLFPGYKVIYNRKCRALPVPFGNSKL